MKQIWKLDHTYTTGLQEKLKRFAKNSLSVAKARRDTNGNFGGAVMVQNYGNHAQVATCMGLNGLLFSNRTLSLLGQHLALGNISFEEYNVDFLSKVVIIDNGRIKNNQRPFIVLCRLFSKLVERVNAGDLAKEDCFVAKSECVKYLFPDVSYSSDQYESGTDNILNEILNNRPCDGDKTWTTHDTWDVTLTATGLFVCKNDAYYIAPQADIDMIKHIANFHYDNVDPDSTKLYDHLAGEKTGILSTIETRDESTLLDFSIKEVFQKFFEEETSPYRMFKK